MFFVILHDKLLCTCLFFLAEYVLIACTIGVLLVAIAMLICGRIFTASEHHSKTINSGNIIDYANDTLTPLLCSNHTLSVLI